MIGISNRTRSELRRYLNIPYLYKKTSLFKYIFTTIKVPNNLIRAQTPRTSKRDSKHSESVEVYGENVAGLGADGAVCEKCEKDKFCEFERRFRECERPFFFSELESGCEMGCVHFSLYNENPEPV